MRGSWFRRLHTPPEKLAANRPPSLELPASVLWMPATRRDRDPAKMLAVCPVRVHRFGNAPQGGSTVTSYTRSLPTLLPALGLICVAASPLAVVEYQIPRDRAFPHDPAVGKDGIVWYTDQQNSFIGRLDPTSGKITDYATPTPASGPHGIVVAPDGSVWYTAQRLATLGRLDPRTGHIEEFSLPAAARDPHTPLIR